MRGVIDRIEDGIAVILIDEKQREWSVAEIELPEGSVEGTVVQLEEKDGAFKIISIDQEATAAATKKAQMLQKKLQAKKKHSKFKRN